MRIYIADNDKSLNEVEIYLTVDEAEDFYLRINDLANNPLFRDDVVFEDIEQNDDSPRRYSKTIEMIIYTKNNLDTFSERMKKIIIEDK